MNAIIQLIDALQNVIDIIIGAFQDPVGAVNSFVCRIIDLLDFALPSTPPQFQIATFIDSAFSTTIPPIGQFAIYELFQTAFGMLAIVLIIKIYKLIPFKAS